MGTAPRPAILGALALALIAPTAVRGEDAGTGEARWIALRDRMVAEQIQGRDVADPRVLAAMRNVPRHRFVPDALRPEAYDDHPLPIGEGQTISQPYIVGIMSELMQLTGGERVLEVGTGSGYQAAVLAELAAEVYSIEILEPLARRRERHAPGTRLSPASPCAPGTATSAGPRRLPSTRSS